jgi:hypothetical protein
VRWTHRPSGGASLTWHVAKQSPLVASIGCGASHRRPIIPFGLSHSGILHPWSLEVYLPARDADPVAEERWRRQCIVSSRSNRFHDVRRRRETLIPKPSGCPECRWAAPAAARQSRTVHAAPKTARPHQHKAEKPDRLTSATEEKTVATVRAFRIVAQTVYTSIAGR